MSAWSASGAIGRSLLGTPEGASLPHTDVRSLSAPPCRAIFPLRCSSWLPAGPSDAGAVAWPPAEERRPRRLGEKARPKSVRRKLRRIETCRGAPALDEQVDRLWRQGALFNRAPAVDRTKDRSFRNVCPPQPHLESRDRSADQEHSRLVVGRGRLGAAESDRKAGQGRAGQGGSSSGRPDRGAPATRPATAPAAGL